MHKFGITAFPNTPQAGVSCREKYYIGLFKFDPEQDGDKEKALMDANRALDRMKVKLLEGLISREQLQQELHVCHPLNAHAFWLHWMSQITSRQPKKGMLQFPLEQYQGDDEMHLRATLSLEEFRAQLMSDASNSRGLRGSCSTGLSQARGVYEKKDRRGRVQAYEARYTHNLQV